jgi:hypothetical protein
MSGDVRINPARTPAKSAAGDDLDMKRPTAGGDLQ